MQLTQEALITSAKRAILIERDALNHLLNQIDESFAQMCTQILACEGRTIVTGLGKSGHIGNKIAATLASTGTPSFFMHPTEASHGDLGMITHKDIVLAISHSGNTEELVNILPLIKRLNVPLYGISSNPNSTLAKQADIHLNINIKKEACPLGLAPTASTTATLALGDALAVTLLEARGFTQQDFALSHPGGSLGKSLLLKATDIMHTGTQLPVVNMHVTIKEALLEMTTKGLGMTTVVNNKGQLQGIYTDGDLRRSLQKNLDLSTTSIVDEMTSECHTVDPDILAAKALQLMEAHKINGLVVTDKKQCPIGAFNMQDLIQAKIL